MKGKIFDILYSDNDPETKLDLIENILLSDRYKFGDHVRVNQLDDDTAKKEYLYKSGVVIAINDNGETGNTKADPLYEVQFADNTHESFWKTELTKIL